MINRIQKTLAITAVTFVMVVIALGAFTRLADAGLGCPDWPGCYGYLHISSDDAHAEKATAAYPHQPYEHEKAWPEMVHRYFAGTLGLLVFGLFICAWLLKSTPNSTTGLSTGLLILIVFQAALGAWTVTEKLHPMVVMGHLLGGFTCFSLLVVLCVRLYFSRLQIPASEVQKFKRFTTLAIVILGIQIALGGWTSANYAAEVCKEFPICFDGWQQQTDFVEGFKLWGHDAETYQYGVVSSEARIAIHATHRIGALITFLVIGFLVFNLFKTTDKTTKLYSIVIGVVLLLQILLGISNVVFHLPLSVAVAHNGVAAILLVTLVSYRTLIWLSGKRQRGEI